MGAAKPAAKQPRGAPKPKKVKKVAKKQPLKFVLDCSGPVNDGMMDPANFEKFLHDHIKVGGKPGKLGDKVVISRDKAKITVTAEPPFSKRYLKYLTRKFLKKSDIRDYVRAVASGKQSYALRYYSAHTGDDQE